MAPFLLSNQSSSVNKNSDKVEDEEDNSDNDNCCASDGIGHLREADSI